MSQGFKGKELGQKIKDLEIKKFKELLRWKNSQSQ
jgi:hypothetical protein